MRLRTGMALLALLLLTHGAGAQTTAAAAFTFAGTDYVSDAGARGIVSADFDNDGAEDFATANAGTNTVDVFLNREFTGGGFSVKRYAVGVGPFDITAADLDFDGYPDLMVAAADADEIDVLFGGVGGVFKAPQRIPAPGNPRGVAVGWLGFGGYAIVYSSFLNGTITIVTYNWDTQSFTPNLTLRAGTNPQGVVIGPFKYDGGYPDIAVANAGSSGITLFLGNSGGTTFTRTELTAVANTNEIVTGDFNHDGHNDLAVASTAQNMLAVFVSGPGGFGLAARFTGTLSSPRGLIARDLNLDGRPELIVANRGSSSVTVFVADATPQLFTTHQIVKSGSGARTVAAGDFDGDGRTDLATGNEFASAGTVLWNRTPFTGGAGATAFELRALPDVNPDGWTTAGPYVIDDFNHNGIPDVVVADGIVLDGKSAVKVDSGQRGAWVAGAVAGDFNEDGHRDLAEVTYYQPSETSFEQVVAVDVMIGDGAGKFTLKSTVPLRGIRGIVAGDFNRDGHTDVVVFDQADNGNSSRKVLLGAGNGTFTVSETPMIQWDYLLAAPDLNRDGNLDLFVWNGPAQQMRVYLGDGRGAFPSMTTTSIAGSIFSLEVADLNGDGVRDVVALRYGTGIIAWLGRGDGTFSSPRFSDLPGSGDGLVVADFTGDGKVDALTHDGILAVGNGDGTFAHNRKLNLSFNSALAADMDGDGLKDLVINTYFYTAMAVYNRTVEPPNAAPIAKVWPKTLSIPFVAQFDEVGFSIEGTKSYDPNSDTLSYTWFENERAIGNGWTLWANFAPGTHVVTLVVRDNAGAESRDTATITITPYEEIVAYPGFMANPTGAWTWGSDATAAAEATMWHPNANGAKLAGPLANPANYFDLWFPADPTQEYKLWIRLKAQNDNPFNDSVFVQFDGAVDASGAPVYQIGTTSALAVNLEECSGCGLSGWGWRDEAWGTRGAIGTVTLRFPPDAQFNRMSHRMRIQTREDGVMIDQIVLSAVTYKRTRPGAVKNDATILAVTVPWD